MLFNSIDFLFFFPLVVLVYLIVPRKIRYIWVLIASYYFYMSWNPRYIVLILFSTLVTWLGGLLIEKTISQKRKKLYVVISIALNLLVLTVFKYSDFLINSLEKIIKFHGMKHAIFHLDLVLPVGISFYTFQAISYVIDVYRGNSRAERNVIKYALFVSFFPQLVAGPIERTNNLMPQIDDMDRIEVWNYEQIRDGLMLMMWGLFQKLVLADRVAMLVNEIYDNYAEHGYGALEIAIATVFFAIQIYCDFSAYSDIARGAAGVMGISLSKNFRQPYLASDIRGFWRRWHISLTSWFTDYLYIPLGGNRKGKKRKYINTIVVFLCSGLWHGAGWNYVIWGGLHGIYLVIEDLLGKFHGKRNAFTAMVKRGVSLGLICFAWLFFRAKSVGQAFGMIIQSMHVWSFRGYGLGLNRNEIIIALVAIIVILCVDLIREKKGSMFTLINNSSIIIRWMLYLGVFWVTLLFGVYGIDYKASEFIYFQF